MTVRLALRGADRPPAASPGNEGDLPSLLILVYWNTTAVMARTVPVLSAPDRAVSRGADQQRESHSRQQEAAGVPAVEVA
jgi:hypothetical protein